MKKDVFFIRRKSDDVAEEPPWDLVLAVARILEASGCTLNVTQEDSWVYGKVKEAIREKGISHFTDTVELMEAVLADNTPKDEYTDLLRYMVRNIQASQELLLIDPYLFPIRAASDYVSYLEKIFATAIGGINRLEIITSKKQHSEKVEAAFLAMVRRVKPGLLVAVRYTNAFHDRFWIADKARGVFCGTSLNGIGSRYSLADYLKDADVQEIVARAAGVL
jgi:hypothetical protein